MAPHTPPRPPQQMVLSRLCRRRNPAGAMPERGSVFAAPQQPQRDPSRVLRVPSLPGHEPTTTIASHPPQSSPRKPSPLLRLNPRKYLVQVKLRLNIGPKHSRKVSPLTEIGLFLRTRSTARCSSRKDSPIGLNTKINNNFIHLPQIHRVPLEMMGPRKASP